MVRRGADMVRRHLGRAGAAAATAVAVAVVPTGATGASATGATHAPGAPPSPPPGELAPIHGPYAPRIDPANFVARIDNRYLPYEPGTRFHMEGVRGTTPQTDDEVVLHRTKRILGVRCTVVRDTVSEHGHAVERTFDWYAQDRQGNVWYMGEDAFELHNGRFAKASDSWHSGVNGAKPGIIMPADP